MRTFYITLASSIAKKFPFKNEVLPLLRFLGMPSELNTKDVMDLAKMVPNVIPTEEIDQLGTEIGLFNLRDKTSSLNVAEPALAWHQFNTQEDCLYPHLCRLALACCTIFHGNADAKCAISTSHEIDDNEKRNCLSGMFHSLITNKQYFLP